MSVEVKPFGVKCNIQCQYCYQHAIRDAGNLPDIYDMKKIRSALEIEGRPFGLFGGEPLLMRKSDLEDLWAWGLERFGKNAIQTNATLVDADHIRMFKQYNVAVGISLDGPGKLNDARWCGSREKTTQSTAKVESAVELLCHRGVTPTIIITLTRKNADRQRLPILYDWVRYLDELNIRTVRLHILESESNLVSMSYGLSTEDNLRALLGFAELEKQLRQLKFDLFRDMRNLLQGRDQNATCIWTGCDPYTTRAVTGIEGDGQRTNCGRTNKDGIDYVKSNTEGFERYLALCFTPQEAGGCKGCRFFLMCKGQCPGTSLEGDWRSRSEHCDVWKGLFETFEAELSGAGIEPLSQSPLRINMEQAFVTACAQGRMPTIASLLEHCQA